MPKKSPKKKPVRRPSQERAVATVEAILEAAARILDREGSTARFTASRIAREAGVGVGSLYEYFASKEAIVATLLERHATGVRLLVDAAVAGYGHLPIEEALDRFVDALFALHLERPGLQERLHQVLPSVHGLDRFVATDRIIGEQVEAWLAGRQPERDPEERAARVFVAVRAVRVVVNQSFAERLDETQRDRVRATVKDLLRALLG